MEVNFLGYAHLLQKVYVQMSHQKCGHVVTISSVASQIPGLKMTEYCATKAAVSSLHQTLQIESKINNVDIQFTHVCPYSLTSQKGWQQKMNQLFPSLQEENVATQVYNAILEKRAELFIPQSWQYTATLLRSFPASWIDKIILFMTGGINEKLFSRYKQINADGFQLLRD